MGKGKKDMTKKQLEKMDRVQFLNKVLFKVAQAHADRQYLWDETEFTKLIRAWEDAHNVYGVIDWEDLYDDNGDYMGIRVEDEIIYQSEYRDEHPEIFN